MSGSQDPELSAALGWPGGISDPVLDRKVLLQMVAALMRDKLWEDHRVRHLWDQAQEQAEPVEPVGEVLHDWSTEKECIAGTWAHLNVLGKNLPVGTKLYTAPPQRTYLVKFAQEQEREECAQIADAEASIEGIAQRIAAAIRARGNK